jgi:hypothetical protein
MKKNITQYYRSVLQSKGFVLPFTLFVTSMMLLITTSISTTLIKQLYFSKLARQSQAAYYAADNAIACTMLIDDTYRDADGGFFPYDPNVDVVNTQSYLTDKLSAVNTQRGIDGLPSLISWDDVVCGQSTFFKVGPPNYFEVSTTPFERTLPSPLTGTESGWTSTFKVKMKLDDNNFRCATVTVNKTPTWRQVISQGYALCDRPDGSVERAVINTTVTE